MITEFEDRAFLVELSGGNKGNRMEHLTCFAGGMFSLGAHLQAVSQETTPRHMEIAKKLAQTCFNMYKSTSTGLSPESVSFDQNGGSLWPNAPYYILRPEAVESFFVLWRTTHDPIYREWGWKVFEAIEKNCRVPGGYTGLRDANRPSDESNYDDLQQTFLLAETFKYLFLLFSDDDVISLDNYVFNTEAHPLSVFGDFDQWSPAFTDLFP
jgi:mannosyl-oligosaccharide alpha-1,2-mannosidase